MKNQVIRKIMKTILVPTDFSKCADNALHYALEIARRTGAQISLLHIIYPNEGVENNVYEAFWIDTYVEERRKALGRLAKRLQKKPAYKGVTINADVTIGFPVGEISRRAKETKPDMIIMGTTGATGLRDIFLGSVAGGVISKSTVPVLVVPAKAPFKENGNVVFATDFHLKTSKQSLELFHNFLKLIRGKLKVVHVLDKPGEPDKKQENSFSEKIGDLRHDFHYIHDRNVQQAVNNFLEATDAIALVSVSHEHSLFHRLFFESMTKKLAHQAEIPMLVLHDA